MAEGELPKESVVKVGKLFTTHRSLIAGRFGAIKEEKLKKSSVVCEISSPAMNDSGHVPGSRPQLKLFAEELTS